MGIARRYVDRERGKAKRGDEKKIQYDFQFSIPYLLVRVGYG